MKYTDGVDEFPIIHVDEFNCENPNKEIEIKNLLVDLVSWPIIILPFLFSSKKLQLLNVSFWLFLINFLKFIENFLKLKSLVLVILLVSVKVFKSFNIFELITSKWVKKCFCKKFELIFSSVKSSI